MNHAALSWLGICLLAVGCARSDVARSDAPTDFHPPKSGYLVDAEPAGAVPVGTARERVEDGQHVSLLGVIGGSSEPFVDGLAAFTIVDPKVPFCAADEGCPTPWDYCCQQEQVADNIATVKLVDESGLPVSADARELLGARELATVVVTGVARRDAQGNLSIAARQVFVRP